MKKIREAKVDIKRSESVLKSRLRADVRRQFENMGATKSGLDLNQFASILVEMGYYG